MIYAQIKSGRKLHLVFQSEGWVSNPICGIKKHKNYRMTINVPLANACKNCLRVYNANGGKKIKKEFYNSLIE